MHDGPDQEAHAAAPLDRLAFETLLTDVSAQLVAAPVESIEHGIDIALQQLLTSFGADRCALLAVSDNQKVVVSLYGAYSEGMAGVSGDLNLVEHFPWAARALLTEHEPVIVRRMSELPP